MTTIEIKKSSDEYKKGFAYAMKMILRWIKSSPKKDLKDLKQMIEVGLALHDLINKEGE